MDDEQRECADRPPEAGAGGDHRWRRDRDQRGLPPREAGVDRRGPAGARPADLGHHLACRRPDRVGRHDHRDVGVDDQVLDRPLRAARGGDGPVDRLQARRLPPDGEQPRADAQAAARGRLPPADGDRTRGDLCTRGRRAVAARRPDRRARRVLHRQRGPRRPLQRGDVAGGGGAGGRRPHRAGGAGHRHHAARRPGHRRGHRTRNDRGRVRGQLRRDVGSPDRRDGGRVGAAPGDRARLPDHRAVRRRVARPADLRGPRPLRLLPRGDRRTDGRPVRAGRRAVVDRSDPRRLQLRRDPVRLGPAVTVPRVRDGDPAGPRRRRRPQAVHRAGELHPRQRVPDGGGARARRVLRRRRLQLARHPHRWRGGVDHGELDRRRGAAGRRHRRRRGPPPALADQPAVPHRAQRRAAGPTPLDGLVAELAADDSA